MAADWWVSKPGTNGEEGGVARPCESSKVYLQIQTFRCDEGVRINRKSERRLRRSGSGPMGKYVVGRKHNSPSLEVHFGAERKKCTFPLALVG